MSYSAAGIKVYEQFKKNLQEQDYKFKAFDDDLVLMLTVHGEDLPQPTIIRVIDDRDVVQIVSPIPAHIPEDKRFEAAVAVAVANYGMLNGSFDYDLNDGEIRFRITQIYSEMELSDEAIKHMLATAFFTTDDYNDKFFMFSKGMMSLEQFIEQEKND